MQGLLKTTMIAVDQVYSDHVNYNPDSQFLSAGITPDGVFAGWYAERV